MEWIKFNLNHRIKVRLLEKGYKHLAEIWNNSGYAKLYKESRDKDFFKGGADENGYTEFQAWDFIQKFGEVTEIGMSDYYETEILIEPPKEQ